jgi:hypothetical protein
MSYVVVHQFPGGTQSQYEASVGAVHPADGSLPPGQLSHIAGPSADGWAIVVVYDSKENWETFRDDVLMPQMAAGIEGGFTAPPQESGFEVFTNVSA